MGRTIAPLLALPAILLAGGALASPSVAAGDPHAELLVAIVASGSHVREVSLGTLRRVFRGELVESADGDRFRPFNLPAGDAARVRFDRLVLGMDPPAVARYWIDRQIRGLGTSPRAIPSASLICRIVARIPGAIAYVHVSQLGTGVRALRLGGKAPGEPGYPLTD